MPNDKCQRPVPSRDPGAPGERNAENGVNQAHGNGESLKGSDSRAQANGLGRRVGNPTTNQALSLRTPGRKAARAAHTGRMPGRTGKGRDKSVAGLAVAPF